MDGKTRLSARDKRRSRSTQEALKFYFVLGHKARNAFSNRYAPHGKLGPFAARHGVEPDTLRKARAFARLFSQRDFEAVMNAKGQAVSWAHIRLLVSVPTPKERMQLVRKIVKNEWTARQLSAEIVRTRPHGPTRRGRPRKIVTASRPEQMRILIAAAREFLATIAPGDYEQKRLKEWSGRNFAQLFEGTIVHARKTIARFRSLGEKSTTG